MPRSFIRIAAAMTVAALAGCAGVPQAPSPASTADSNTVAVASLMENARSDASAGRLANAAASMERAIRLAPRNPLLWQELARLRLKQGEFVQAEHVALRSSSFTRGDANLRVANWHIIAQAREARGDAEGARAARELAKRTDY